MALDNFIPEVWSARLLQRLRNALVYGQPGVINRDYEGEIQAAGDTVHISSIGTVTIGDYSKNTNIGDPETLSDAQRTLTITEQKFFNFQIDDVDRAQMNIQVMDEAMTEAAYGLRNVADSFISGLYTQIPSTNEIGTQASPKSVTVAAANAYELLVDLGTALDETNTPDTGRWVVVPPWYEGYLLKDDRFVSFGTLQNVQTLTNGMIGRVAGFDVLKSNQVPVNSTVSKIIAGHAMAWSYAEQVSQVEAYRPHQRFADAVKGLHVYGAKVVRPANLALLDAVAA